MPATPIVRPLALFAALAIASPLASAVELAAGGGSTGGEVGVVVPLAPSFTARLEANVLRYGTDFTSDDGIHYDAKLKGDNAGVYLDAFVFESVRVSGGALIGRRVFHGTATSLGDTVDFNGTTYPVSPGDALGFDAKFPRVSPYLGIGWGHRPGAGLHLYADAGVAWGRPTVTLSPTASLLMKVSPSDLAAEQSSVQDKANRYRAYPVLKIGLAYAF